MAIKAKVAVKTSAKSKSDKPRKSLLGPIAIMNEWQQNPEPPDILSWGDTWALVAGPVSDEELLRESCKLTHTPPSGPTVTIESGDIGYPFDGSCFLLSNLAAGKHIFTAQATYPAGNQPVPQSVEITLP